MAPTPKGVAMDIAGELHHFLVDLDAFLESMKAHTSRLRVMLDEWERMLDRDRSSSGE